MDVVSMVLNWADGNTEITAHIVESSGIHSIVLHDVPSNSHKHIRISEGLANQLVAELGIQTDRERYGEDVWKP